MAWGTIGGSVAATGTSWLLNDLAGTPGRQQGAADAADPFAHQRAQYQAQLNRLMSGGFDPSSSSTDPSYASRLAYGNINVDRGLAAAGMGGGSGSQLAGLQQYGQNMASQEYTAQFNRLSSLAGVNAGSPAAAGGILNGQVNGQIAGLGQIGNAVGKGVQSWIGGGSSSYQPMSDSQAAFVGQQNINSAMSGNTTYDPTAGWSM